LRGVALNDGTLDPARLYLGNCASCHQAHGKGTPDRYYPPLLHNTTVGASNPGNLVQVIPHGVHRRTAGSDVGMPAPAAVERCADRRAHQLRDDAVRQSGGDAGKRDGRGEVAVSWMRRVVIES
jgi:mono/diheme cytochrome c family protein